MPSGGGRPVRGPRHRDVTSQTRTPTALGAEGSGHRIPQPIPSVLPISWAVVRAC